LTVPPGPFGCIRKVPVMFTVVLLHLSEPFWDRLGLSEAD
jgi:hypothetical protein